MGGRADGRTGRRTGGRVGGLADDGFPKVKLLIGGQADRRTGGRVDASADMAMGNPTWPSSGNYKVTRFTSSVTVTVGSDTMSCRHHADFVVTL